MKTVSLAEAVELVRNNGRTILIEKSRNVFIVNIRTDHLLLTDPWRISTGVWHRWYDKDFATVEEAYKFAQTVTDEPIYYLKR